MSRGAGPEWVGCWWKASSAFVGHGMGGFLAAATALTTFTSRLFAFLLAGLFATTVATLRFIFIHHVTVRFMLNIAAQAVVGHGHVLIKVVFMTTSGSAHHTTFTNTMVLSALMVSGFAFVFLLAFVLFLLAFVLFLLFAATALLVRFLVATTTRLRFRFFVAMPQ